MTRSKTAEPFSSCVMVHTDSLYIGNPGPGGYAAVVKSGAEWSVIKGYENPTTNKRLELLPAIKAIETLKTDEVIAIVSHSKYLVDGMNKWLAGWKANGWRTKANKPIGNLDLWHRLDVLVASRKNGVLFTWMPSHSGEARNAGPEATKIASLMGVAVGQMLARTAMH